MPPRSEDIIRTPQNNNNINGKAAIPIKAVSVVSSDNNNKSMLKTKQIIKAVPLPVKEDSASTGLPSVTLQKVLPSAVKIMPLAPAPAPAPASAPVATISVPTTTKPATTSAAAALSPKSQLIGPDTTILTITPAKGPLPVPKVSNEQAMSTPTSNTKSVLTSESKTKLEMALNGPLKKVQSETNHTTRPTHEPEDLFKPQPVQPKNPPKLQQRDPRDPPQPEPFEPKDDVKMRQIEATNPSENQRQELQSPPKQQPPSDNQRQEPHSPPKQEASKNEHPEPHSPPKREQPSKNQQQELPSPPKQQKPSKNQPQEPHSQSHQEVQSPPKQQQPEKKTPPKPKPPERKDAHKLPPPESRKQTKDHQPKSKDIPKLQRSKSFVGSPEISLIACERRHSVAIMAKEVDVIEQPSAPIETITIEDDDDSEEEPIQLTPQPMKKPIVLPILPAGITISTTRRSSGPAAKNTISSRKSSSSSSSSDVVEVPVSVSKLKEELSLLPGISIVKAESLPLTKEDFERSLRCDEQVPSTPPSSSSSASVASDLLTPPKSVEPAAPRPPKNGDLHIQEALPSPGARANALKKNMHQNLPMLQWRGQQPANLQNSSLRFELNRFNLLQLNERCEPRQGPANYFERALYDRPGRRPSGSVHPLLYLCQRCNCHGPAADFLAPRKCLCCQKILFS